VDVGCTEAAVTTRRPRSARTRRTQPLATSWMRADRRCCGRNTGGSPAAPWIP